MDQEPDSLAAPLPSDISSAFAPSQGLPDRLVVAFRDLILAGRWKPGAQIVETSIAKQFGVSQPSVREALKTLEAEGLVMRRPYRSCEVTDLSVAEVEQIFRLRVEFEALAAELAVENARSWRPDDLAQAVRALEDAADRGDAEAFYRSDMTFHRTLWRYSGNLFLERALLQITIPLFAFWMLQRLKDSDVDLHDQAQKHKAIAEAVFSKDKDHAAAVTRAALKGFWADGVRVAGKPR